MTTTLRRWWKEFCHWWMWGDEWAENCEMCNPEKFRKEKPE